MRVIPPLPITETRFTSSTVAEPYAPTAYAGGTPYAFDDIVSVAADFTIYKSLAAGNTGHTPSTSPTWWEVVGPTETAYNGATTNYALGATVSANHRVYESLVLQTVSNPLPVWPATTTAFWMDVGPTNKWAMFDVLRNTRTIAPTSLTVVVTPGRRVDSFAVMGMRNVNTLHITAVSGASTIYDYTATLSTRTLTDWYSYFFGAFNTKTSEVHFDIPPDSSCVITLVLTATSGNVECGAFVLGSSVYIGATQYNAVSDYVNYSTVTRDFAGKVNLMTQRPGAPKTNQQVMIDKTRAQFIRDTIMALDATPAVWSGIDDDTSGYFAPLLILGFATNAPINIGYPDKAMLTLELTEI